MLCDSCVFNCLIMIKLKDAIVKIWVEVLIFEVSPLDFTRESIGDLVTEASYIYCLLLTL